MADFLITARITLPDSSHAAGEKARGPGPPVEAFSAALEQAMGALIAVKLERVRAAKGSIAAANLDEPSASGKSGPARPAIRSPARIRRPAT